MKPVLWSFSGGNISTYGVAVALGLLLGVALTARQARRAGLDAGAVVDLAFWLVVTGLVGSRLFFLALNAGDFIRLCRDEGDCTAALRLWEGGLVFYGGALTAGLVAAWWTRRRGWHLGQVADLFIPGLALGHAIGRLGCFAAGCCYGKACSGVACVVFPRGSVAFADLAQHGHLGRHADATPPLHPTQLYEAAGNLAIFFLVLAWRPRQRRHGELVLLYACAYALLRLLIELFRGDSARRFVAELTWAGLARAFGLPTAEPLFLSTSQLISVLVIVASAATLWVRRQHKKEAGAATSR